MDDCKHNQINCQNGGFCIDLVNDYRCVCSTGFFGPHCDRIDESVCELIPNHVWRYNDTECEKVCVCQGNSSVNCRCMEEKSAEELHCNGGVNLKSEIKVVFDSNVTIHSCNTIYTIQTLVANDDHFCCYSQSSNEVTIRIDEKNPLAQYITRTIFPHIMHVIVNSSLLDRSTFSLLNMLITLLSLIFMATLYFTIHSYYKKRRQESDAENVVIHCIQNNLKSSPSEFKSLTPPSSNTMSKKLCNTLQYDRGSSNGGSKVDLQQMDCRHMEIKKCIM